MVCGEGGTEVPMTRPVKSGRILEELRGIEPRFSE